VNVDALADQARLVAGDIDGTARLLHDLIGSRRALSDIIATLEAELVDLMPDRRVELDGLPPFERRKATVRKRWQSDDLVRRLCRDALDPDGTGEIPGTPMAAVDAVVSALTECAPFTPSMQWRAGALRDRGLDVDEWCESSPGPVRVQWHEAAS